MAFIDIAGKRFPLRFDMSAMEMAEYAFGSFEKMQEELRSGKIGAIINVVYIMALCHAESEDKELKESRNWFAHNLDPRKLGDVGKAIGAALSEGMSTQEESDLDDGDVVLAEIQKKSRAE